MAAKPKLMVLLLHPLQLGGCFHVGIHVIVVLRNSTFVSCVHKALSQQCCRVSSGSLANFRHAAMDFLESGSFLHSALH